MKDLRGRGTTLSELIVSCMLFSVFTTVALGLFSGMTRTVRREQQPAERLAEGRVAALKIARRLRNCEAMLRPSLRELLGQPSSTVMLRDGVLRKTVEWKVEREVLYETSYPYLYNPLDPGEARPEKGLRLCGARSFVLSSGGISFPTRMSIDIVLSDGRTVHAVTNLREAI